MERAITPEELEGLRREKKELIILDVRRKPDFEADKRLIPGAVWRDPEQVEQWSGPLASDDQIVIYCVRGGSVSQSVAEKLLQKDLNVKYIAGGINAWKESGGAVEGQ